MALEKIPRKTVEATLPGGRTITLREPSGADELRASKEAGSGDGAAVLLERALTMRCITHVNGEAVDQAAWTAQTVSDFFSAQEWVAIRRLLIEGFFLMTPEEEAALEASKRFGSAG